MDWEEEELRWLSGLSIIINCNSWFLFSPFYGNKITMNE